MRNICWFAIIGASTLALLGCSGSTPTNPAGAGMSATIPVSSFTSVGVTTANAGEFHIDVDLKTGKATVTPRASRNGSAIGDLFYLKVNQFGLSLGGISLSGFDPITDTVELHYDIAHSFPAPATLGGPATAANRADLGVSGRVVFLEDAPSGRVPDANSPLNKDDYEFPFASGTEVMNTKAILNADGFFDPAGTLSTTPANGTTAYPFKVLVDESQDNRVYVINDSTGISNGGDSHGNYTSTINWSATSALTPDRIAYTGYGVLHQGQRASNFIVFSVAPGAATISLDTAIIATYSDPRGGTTSAAKRANRLPSNDPTKFAYRMPHGAVDMEQIAISNNGPLGTAPGATATCDISIVDQDASATVGTGLGEIPNPSGIDSIELVSGELGVQAAFATPPSGTGPWEDPLVYVGSLITNSTGSTGGIDNAAYICIRLVDEQVNAVAGLEQGITLSNNNPPGPVAGGAETETIVFRPERCEIP
ncbi:MAG: hypothetical protein ABI743_05940 [bacterium]